MIKKNAIKRYFRQISAIVEKNILLDLRIKTYFYLRFVDPIIQLFILFIVFGIIFNVNKGVKIGYWDSTNYILFLLIAFSVFYTRSIIDKFNANFQIEKYWKTLSAILMAPINRFILLIGLLISEIILNLIPLIVFFVLALILFPIPFIFIILVLIIYFSIVLIFASIGLLISAFGISKESIAPYISILLKFVFLFSCANYPKEIFPEFIQFIILLNPFYYIIDLLRLAWYLGINYEVAVSNITLTHIIIFILFVILSPIISVYIFESVYKKYGIRGY